MEEEEETININLIIADRPYPLKIRISEEEDIRIAAKKINQRVKDLTASYEARDKQDFIAMSALMCEVEMIVAKKNLTSTDQKIDDELIKFEKFIKTLSN